MYTMKKIKRIEIKYLILIIIIEIALLTIFIPSKKNQNLKESSKLISMVNNKINNENISYSINAFYNTLEKREDYIYNTNKFNCNETGCATSVLFNNIGIICEYEYNKLINEKSYLYPKENYVINNNDVVKNLTTEGLITLNSWSGLRPSIYLQSDVSVTGTGSSNDPFILVSKEYLVTLKAKNATVDKTSKTIKIGENTSFTVTAKQGYTLEESKLTCTNGAIPALNENTINITNITHNTECTLEPKLKKYTVILKGLTEEDTSIEIEYGKTIKYKIKPKENDYLSAVTCTDGYTVTDIKTGTEAINEQEITINNNKKDNASTCSFEFASLISTCNVTRGDWTGAYTCKNSSCEIVACRHNPTGYYCDGGTGGFANKTIGCTSSSTYTQNMSYRCNSGLGKNYASIYGGGMSERIDISTCN